MMVSTRIFMNMTEITSAQTLPISVETGRGGAAGKASDAAKPGAGADGDEVFTTETVALSDNLAELAPAEPMIRSISVDTGIVCCT